MWFRPYSWLDILALSSGVLHCPEIHQHHHGRLQQFWYARRHVIVLMQWMAEGFHWDFERVQLQIGSTSDLQSMLCLPSWTRRLQVSLPLAQICTHRSRDPTINRAQRMKQALATYRKASKEPESLMAICSIGNVTWWISWEGKVLWAWCQARSGALSFTLWRCKPTGTCGFDSFSRFFGFIVFSSPWCEQPGTFGLLRFDMWHCGRRLRRWHLSLRPIGT